MRSGSSADTGTADSGALRPGDRVAYGVFFETLHGVVTGQGPSPDGLVRVRFDDGTEQEVDETDGLAVEVRAGPTDADGCLGEWTLLAWANLPGACPDAIPPGHAALSNGFGWRAVDAAAGCAAARDSVARALARLVVQAGPLPPPPADGAPEDDVLRAARARLADGAVGWGPPAAWEIAPFDAAEAARGASVDEAHDAMWEAEGALARLAARVSDVRPLDFGRGERRIALFAVGPGWEGERPVLAAWAEGYRREGAGWAGTLRLSADPRDLEAGLATATGEPDDDADPFAEPEDDRAPDGVPPRQAGEAGVPRAATNPDRVALPAASGDVRRAVRAVLAILSRASATRPPTVPAAPDGARGSVVRPRAPGG